tara:strand:+ start:36 stop:212 length:177 start_codon:yes stop_codon:yes gene_type:complete
MAKFTSTKGMLLLFRLSSLQEKWKSKADTKNKNVKKLRNFFSKIYSVTFIAFSKVSMK